MENKVYSFQYNFSVYESDFTTMSLHYTKKGAYFAMRKHILKDYEEWRENGLRFGKQKFKHGEYESWRIISMPIFE